MYEIELHKDAVDVRMDETERALDRLSLPSPPSHRKNHLAVTGAWTLPASIKVSRQPKPVLKTMKR
ncbi:hypothetical protein [Sporolactobacillus shoreae]|uniref:hypothetical protein n=1 Tax=Sporolactobacillus shoreae TaxID=1465501 RepID=UPI001F4F1420|nr:hypothetical protein [Sporolactobacillus shoreae]